MIVLVDTFPMCVFCHWINELSRKWTSEPRHPPGANRSVQNIDEWFLIRIITDLSQRGNVCGGSRRSGLLEWKVIEVTVNRCGFAPISGRQALLGCQRRRRCRWRPASRNGPNNVTNWFATLLYRWWLLLIKIWINRRVSASFIHHVNMENRDLSADGWCGFKWAFGGIFSAILNVISDAISYFLRARLNWSLSALACKNWS